MKWFFVLENIGNTDWPDGCHLRYIGGEKFPGTPDSVPVPALNPGCQTQGKYIKYKFYFLCSCCDFICKKNNEMTRNFW